MTSEAPINMPLLRNKIVEGITQIQKKVNENEAILFIGDTGVGKSTLLSYLIGHQLKVCEIGLKPCLINQSEQSSGLKIGHNKYSQTSIPAKVCFEGMAIFDCPGFNDNKGREEEIANSFYYQRLMSMYDRTKLVIIVDENFLTEARAYRMPQLAKKLQAAFGTLEQVRFSTLLIVNKCSPDSTLEDVEKQLRKLIETENMFSEQQVKFFECLIRNNQLYWFKQPRRSEVGKQIGDQSRRIIIDKMKQLDPMNRIDIKNIISDSAKLAIRDHIDVVEIESGKNMTALMEKVANSVKSAKTGLYLIKQQIMRIFEYRQIMFEGRDFNPFFQFCVSRKISGSQIEKFHIDLQIVEFYSQVYSKTKTQAYYLKVIGIIMNSFSVLLEKVDSMIENEKLEIERKKRKEHRKKEEERIQQLENSRNKENMPPQKLDSPNGSQSTITFKSTKTEKQLKKQNTNDPVVLAFQKKLINAHMKIKQISYEIEEFHNKSAFFSKNLQNYCADKYEG